MATRSFPLPIRLVQQTMLTAVFVLFGGAISLFAQTVTTATPLSPGAKVLAVSQALAAQYNTDSGLFRDTGWWNSANGVTALANASRALGTNQFDSLFANTFVNAQKLHPLFRNEFYDDEGWWALAWIDVYELDHNPRYLVMAESIFSDMTGGWDDTCGGGIWWKKDKHYKNAIANELFLAVAAHLAHITRSKEQAEYVAWAEKEWRWFSASGMINGDSLINDGLNSACHNNGKTVWTYNQGVVVDGLVELSRFDKQRSTLKYARAISTAAISHLTDENGILHDVCEPHCGDDGVQFKGIFVRNLAGIFAIDHSTNISRFLTKNAQSLWETARTPENHFSTVWSGPASDDKSGALIAALDLLTAARGVN